MKFGFWLTLAVCWLLPFAAQAQGCARPDLLEAFPAFGSTNVPLNAILSAHYAVSAEYDGEPVVLEQVGGERRELLATFSPNEGLLSLDPAGFLKPGTAYALEWPALRGIGSASRGRGAKVSFTAGIVNDEKAPEFLGIRDVSYRLDRDQDGCAEAIQDRFVFELTLEVPSDESAREDLSLIVFQTKSDPSQAPVPVQTQSFPENGRVQVVRRIDDSLGQVCFAALARDLTGKVSASADRVVCTKTVKPPFFHGCAFGTGDRPGSVGWAAAFLVGILWARRQRRGA